MVEVTKNLKKKLQDLLGTSNKDELQIILFDNSSGVQLPVEEFIIQYNPEELAKGHCNIVGKIDFKDEAIATFRLRDMIGCAGILIFNDLRVLGSYRHKGIGSEIFNFAREFGKYYGYGLIQATDVVDNDHSNKLFLKNEWIKVTEFVNNKTRNKVGLWNLKL